MKKVISNSLLLLVGIAIGIVITLTLSEKKTVEVVKYVTEKEFVEVSVPLAEGLSDTNEIIPEIRIYNGHLQIKLNDRWRTYAEISDLVKGDPFNRNAEAISELETEMVRKKAEDNTTSSDGSVLEKTNKKSSFASKIKVGEVKKENTKKTENQATNQPAEVESSPATQPSTPSTPATGGGGNTNNGGGNSENNDSSSESDEGKDTQSDWSNNPIF